MDTDQRLSDPPTRQELNATVGPVLVEFGASWCGYCRALAPQLVRLLARTPDVRYIKVEDGPGQPLGRSFQVTLWPTLVFLRDGHVVRKVARPSRQEAEAGLLAISATGPETAQMPLHEPEARGE